MMLGSFTKKDDGFLLLIYSAVVCGSWIWLFPVSGDGDAVMHYENFREGQSYRKSILHPWARPLYAALNLPASYFGMIPSRLFHLALALLMAWQTYLYAKDLKLKHASLAIPFALLQPYAMVLSGDTMTEIPYALLVIIILRLWHFKRYVWVSVLVGLSPLVRPEGFFMGLLLGILFLACWPTGLNIARRWMTASLASCGILLWLLAGYIWVDGNWFYVVDSWPWGGTLNYGSGSIIDYPMMLPFIIGLPLFIFWVLGTFSSPFEKRMIPNQVMWWMVFLVHTIMWAGGVMGSAGLLRIIACVTPFAAITCVKGWGVVVRYLERKQSFLLISARRNTVIFLLFTGLYAVGYNLLIPQNHYGKVTLALHEKFSRLVDDAPAIVSSDPALVSLVHIDVFDDRIQSNFSNRLGQLKMMGELPIGTICLWDDQRGATWHHVKCVDLEDLGYEVIEAYEGRVFPTYYFSAAPLRGVIAVKRK